MIIYVFALAMIELIAYTVVISAALYAAVIYKVQNPYGGNAEPARIPIGKPEIIKSCPSLLMRFIDEVINNDDICALLIETQIKEDQESKESLRSECRRRQAE